MQELTPGGIAATALNNGGLPHFATYNKSLMTPLGISVSPMGLEQPQHAPGLFYNVQQIPGESPREEDNKKK